jgi:short-subunit dehydrogenase
MNSSTKKSAVVMAAGETEIFPAADVLRMHGTTVHAVNADGDVQGVDELCGAANGRKVFLDQRWDNARRVIDTNVTGTVYLLHKVGNEMRTCGSGRALITGSIAGFIPGTFDSFSFALRAELKDSGVTVTCLMPGATETEFFERADMLDTEVGQSKKQDAAEVARIGCDAMLRGDGDIVSGWQNKWRSAIALVTPSGGLAELHRAQAEPGPAEKA